MKRYNIKTTVTEREDFFARQIDRQLTSVIEESPRGEWVRWDDVEELRKYLEDQIPEKRIAKLERALGLVSSGKCPECEQVVRDYEAPLGSFAPEAWGTLRENGIDPKTGHKSECHLK